MAVKRLQKEILDIQKDTSENCSAGLSNNSDLFNWDATIIGPTETPYEGGIFYLKLMFPIDYPFKPPKIVFVNRIYQALYPKKSDFNSNDILNLLNQDKTLETINNKFKRGEGAAKSLLADLEFINSKGFKNNVK